MHVHLFSWLIKANFDLLGFSILAHIATVVYEEESDMLDKDFRLLQTFALNHANVYEHIIKAVGRKKSRFVQT